MSKTKYAILALIIANVIWGAAAPIFKWSLESIPPFTLAFLRFGIASIILLPFVYKKLSVKGKDILPLIILSILGISVNIGFFFLGLQKAVSINAPIIGSSAPIFSIIFAFIFLREHTTRKQLVGGALGVIGVLLIIFTPSSGKIDTTIEGNLFFIIAMLSSVVSAIMLKKIIKRYNPLTTVFWSFVIGAITFIPFFSNEISHLGFLPIINTRVVVGIIFGAVFSSALAYFLQYSAIKILSIAEVGIFTYMDPVVAVLIAAPLLGEQPNSNFFVGSFLVFVGIFIAEGRIHYHPIHRLLK